ncbi:copper resistance D family protein [Loktanella sp. S4079]|uniref:copper resistance D family protein n=1 Tax=Loktanella sp. S4079 TaxID=579483 RepID=UPI0005F9B074|nr:CopD family protein [Loktanella sp. S4079]KJZ17191.1 copper-binding protein [Loktanella sp. S4079]
MPDIWEQIGAIFKLLLYIGALGATGLVIIRIVFADLTETLHQRMQRQALCLAGLALLASLFGFALRGAALTGTIAGMIDTEMLGLMWQTPVGDVLVYRIVGTMLMILGLLTHRIGQWIALGGGVLTLWSFAQIGHIPDSERAVVRLILLLHLLGVAFWVGVLPPLYRLSLQPNTIQQAADLGHRFGQRAAAIVPMLILAGVLMGWLLVGSFTTLVTTSYGQTLLIKLAFVGVLLALATVNKLRFVPAMLSGNHMAARHLARSIQIETVMILAVLAATATLTRAVTLPH